MGFFKIVIRTEEKVVQFLAWLGVGLLSVICVTMLAQVFMRRVLRSPIEWAEDLSVFLFIWITFLGAAVLFSRKLLISVDSFVLLLPWKVQVIVEAVVDALILLASFYLLQLSAEFMLRQRALGHNLGGALGIPSWSIMIPVILSLAVMVLSCLASVLRKIRP